jgi:hypothetical protein
VQHFLNFEVDVESSVNLTDFDGNTLQEKIFSSETAWPNGAKLGRKHLCKILYKTSSFNSIRQVS